MISQKYNCDKGKSIKKQNNLSVFQTETDL